MRTLIDLPDEHIRALDLLGESEKVSRAELVRRAVDLYLTEDKKRRSDQAVDKYYGFLTHVPEAFDGLDADAYVQKVRSEWDHRDKVSASWGMHDSANSDFKHQEKP